LARRKPKNGFSVLTLILVILATAVLCGLGAWQVRRLHENQQLKARLAALQFAPAEPLNVVLNHFQAGRDADSIRVETACEPAPPAPPSRIYTVTDDGPGWRPIVLCRLKSGPYPAVMLDLGLETDAAKAKDGALSAPAFVTGVLRRPKAKPLMTAPSTPGEFGWRDADGIAAALGSPDAAKLFLVLEKPVASPDIKPAPLAGDQPRDNLGYVITWFGLAAALIAIYVAALIRRRKAAQAPAV
jgi:surfeit locus 1 family protein